MEGSLNPIEIDAKVPSFIPVKSDIKIEASILNCDPKDLIAIDRTYSYQDELIFYFYNEMLPTIIENWEIVPKSKCGVHEDEETTYNYKYTEIKRKHSISSLKHGQPEESSRSKAKITIKDGEKSPNKGHADYHKSILSKSSLKLQENKNGGSSYKVVHISRNKDMERQSVASMKKIMSAKLPVITESLMNDVKLVYEMTDDSSTPNEIFPWMIGSEDEFVKIKFKNGNEYIGEVSKKRPNGNGTYIWNDGAQYQGTFNNGDIHGGGLLRYPDLSYYQGRFCRGMLNDHGSFFPISTNTVYSGQFKDGKKHGKGWLSYGPNEYYDGEWQFNKKHGLGYEVFLNNTRYKGNWVNNKMEGQGSIVFHNSDFYKGEFKNGLPDGYGEYTWNAIRSNGLACRLENTFQGAWIEGKRDGIGIMHFGMQGSKLAGVWIGNKKHGPGMLVCGNGEMFKRNPLFIDDSPVHMSISKAICSKKANLKGGRKVSSIPMPPTYPSRLDVKVSTSLRFDKNQKASRSDTCIPPILSPHVVLSDAICTEKLSKADVMFPYIEPLCNPIDIPIHGLWFQVDLSFHINKLIDIFCKIEEKEESLDLVRTKSYLNSKWNLLGSENTLFQNALQYIPIRINYDLEERKLRNVILMNHDLLKNVYKKYATLTLDIVHPKFTPVLTRLFMWQMYKDFEMHKMGFSLVQIDLIMMDFDQCDLDTSSQHYPFEKIYLWQFLHLLLQMCFYCYPHNRYYEKYKESGIYAKFFEDFINDYIVPKAGKFEGQLLFKYKDLLPIKSVYFLYKSLGEPHSAKTFLKACCVKKKQEPPPYLKDFDGEDSIVHMENGINILCGINLLYLPDEPVAIGSKPRERPAYPMKKDPFYKDLKLFRSLGTKKIVELLIKVCPLISQDGLISNMNYSLTFLEFYEVLLLCACEITDKLKKAERKRLYAEYLENMPKNCLPEEKNEVSKRGKHSGKAGSKKS